MKNELSIDSLRRDFEKWRQAKVGQERMPEDLVRAAAILAERMSVATVAKQLNINHARISHAVTLLRNERLPLLPASAEATAVQNVPGNKMLTFTKVNPPVGAGSASDSLPVPSGLRVHAKVCLSGGSSFDVTSLRAFRILCETLLKGTD